MIYLALFICYIACGRTLYTTSAGGISGSIIDNCLIRCRRQITASEQVIYLAFGISNICSAADTTAIGSIILQTTSARRISRDIDDPPIVIHCVLLGCGGQTATRRKMEDLALRITDKYLCRA